MKLISGAVAMVFGSCLAVAQTAAQSSSQAARNPLENSRIFPYDQMPVKRAANGTESRDVFNGSLATGEAIAVHESMQPVGTQPVELHKISHSELIVVQEGMIEFEHEGKTERVGPGDLMYVALGTVHRVKNVGNVPAKYVVIAIGGDVKK